MRIKRFLSFLQITVLGAAMFFGNNASISAAAVNSNDGNANLVTNSSLLNAEDNVKTNLINRSALKEDRKLSWQSKAQTRSSVNSITQDFSGTLVEQDDYMFLPLTLADGDIMQATLAGPNNADIDYDLLLYTYDNEELGELVAECGLTTYMNDYDGVSKSVEDAISYINNAGEARSFALFVYATTGFSTTEEFNLTVSLDEDGFFDSNEPNDNPFNATKITDDKGISGCNLNVSNDHDWFVWQVPESYSDGVEIKTSNPNYDVEVYTATGRSVVLKKPNSDGIYKLSPNYHYLRVLNKSTDFVSSDYSLVFTPYSSGSTSQDVKSIKITSFNSDTSPNKVDYGQGSFYRFKYDFDVTVKVTDADGNPVSGQTVYCIWQSGSWVEGSGNDERRANGITNANGEVKFTVNGPPAVGSFSHTTSGPVIIRHYYDIDALAFGCGNVFTGVNMYHLAYSSYVDS